MHGIRINGMWKTFKVPGWGERTEKHKFCNHTIKIKLDCPQIDGFISYKECLVFGDFDVLPAGYDSWDHHFNTLSWKYSGAAYFFRSFSGKTKFCIKVSGYRLSVATMLATIGKILGEDAAGIDQNESALRTTFVLPEYFDGLGKYATNQQPVSPVKVNTFRLKPLPEEFMPNVQGLRRSVLAFILSFNREEVDLPQNFIADTIGCAPSTVRYILDDMTLDGTIRLVDSSVSVGRKAFTYGLAGIVLARLAVRANPETLYLLRAPALIDGAWYAGLWKATNFFSSLEDFLSWVFASGDVHKPGKGRYKMALKAWANHCGAPA